MHISSNTQFSANVLHTEYTVYININNVHVYFSLMQTYCVQSALLINTRQKCALLFLTRIIIFTQLLFLMYKLQDSCTSFGLDYRAGKVKLCYYYFVRRYNKYFLSNWNFIGLYLQEYFTVITLWIPFSDI